MVEYIGRAREEHIICLRVDQYNFEIQYLFLLSRDFSELPKYQKYDKT